MSLFLDRMRDFHYNISSELFTEVSRGNIKTIVLTNRSAFQAIFMYYLIIHFPAVELWQYSREEFRRIGADALK
jgi:hypothetical protein